MTYLIYVVTKEKEKPMLKLKLPIMLTCREYGADYLTVYGWCGAHNEISKVLNLIDEHYKTVTEYTVTLDGQIMQSIRFESAG